MSLLKFVCMCVLLNAAVTVAKECEMVSAESAVFLSKMVVDPVAQTKRIEWIHTDNDAIKLDPVTLAARTSRCVLSVLFGAVLCKSSFPGWVGCQ